MSKSKVVQVVGEKIVPVTGAMVVLPADAPSNEATIVGVDFALRKMDRMHKDAIAARSKKHPLDASLQAFMLGADGNVVAESGFLFYGQPHYAGGVVELVPTGPFSKFHSTMRLRLGAVPQEVKDERWHRFMKKQQAISARRQKKKVGTRQQVLIDELTPQGGKGRSRSDAPEIDGAVHVASRRPLRVGEFAQVKIERADEYDLYGSAVGF